MARRKVGRPPKYGEPIHTAICQALELGMSRTTAAEINGIDRSTLADWTVKYPAFSRDVVLAEAKAKRRATLTITTAIQKGDVNAAFRYLALKEREEWRESQDIKVTHAGSITHHHRDLSHLSDEDLVQLRALAAKIEAGEVAG